MTASESDLAVREAAIAAVRTLPRHPAVAVIGGCTAAPPRLGGCLPYSEIIGRELECKSMFVWANERATATAPDAIRSPDLAIFDADIADWLTCNARAKSAAFPYVPSTDRAARRPIRPGSRQHVRRSIDRMAVTFTAILDNLAKPGRVVVVLAPHEVDPWLWPATAALEYWTEAVASTLANHPEVLLLDPRRVLRHWDDFLDDRVHLNWRGHAKVASVILDAIGTRYGVTLD